MLRLFCEGKLYSLTKTKQNQTKQPSYLALLNTICGVNYNTLFWKGEKSHIQDPAQKFELGYRKNCNFYFF